MSIATLGLLLTAAAAAQPFCAETTERGPDTLVLSCADPSSTIASIDIALYGTPSGSCAAGNLARNASCDWAGALPWARAACVNRTSCVLSAGPPSLPDPCEGFIKTLAVVAQCTGAAGGSAAPIVPPCSMTQGTPPCPLPIWQPVWGVNRSTICQPGNVPSWLDPVAAARWGLVSLDWSIAYDVWRGNGNVSNMTGAATLVEQCRRIKAVDTTTKCFVYRNTELACVMGGGEGSEGGMGVPPHTPPPCHVTSTLTHHPSSLTHTHTLTPPSLEWMEPHRAVMNDPDFAHLFLQYQSGNPSGAPAGAPYNEDAGGPGAGCKQYFWDYTHPDTLEFVLGVSEQGDLATGSPFVDGTFLDDSQAIPQEHADAPANMGLSQLQLLRAQNATYTFFNAAVAALASTGHFIWQGFNGNEQGDPDGVGIAPTSSTCAAFMESTCDASWQAVPTTMQWPSRASDKLPVLAAFLITRGPYSYIGYGWNGGPLPPWDPLWDVYDVGVPTGTCTQTAPGVFARSWSRGTATLDCNTWVAVLDF